MLFAAFTFAVGIVSCGVQWFDLVGCLLCGLHGLIFTFWGVFMLAGHVCVGVSFALCVGFLF